MKLIIIGFALLISGCSRFETKCHEGRLYYDDEGDGIFVEAYPSKNCFEPTPQRTAEAVIR